MKLDQPQCELDGHEIKLTMIECPVPYVCVECTCQTCGKTWLENYLRCWVGEPKETKVEEVKPQLELI